MAEQTFGSDQTIIRYLLNDLPADDQARFEEAYFSDGSLFEQVRALEEDLIDDYVKGDLSGDERRRFESHYLASEQRRARVETTRQLVKLGALKTSAQMARSEHIEGWFFSLRRRLDFLDSQWLAALGGVAAAALLLLVIGLAVQLLRLRGQQAPVNGELASVERSAKESDPRTPEAPKQPPEEIKHNAGQTAGQNSEPPQQSGNRNSPVPQPQSPSQPPNNQIVFLALTPSVRSLARPDRAVISDDTRFVDLRMELEIEESTLPRSYRAVVTAVDGGREIWRQEGLNLQRRGAAQYIVVRIPADRFKIAGAQDFRLTISAITAGRRGYEEVDSHYFQVAAKRN